MTLQHTRRSFLRTTALASGALALGPAFWSRALAEAATATEGPYGPLGALDANGIRLPAGFSARVVARGNEVVPGTPYRFPVQPDGQMTVATRDGGWILVTNSEAPPPEGGASAIRFDAGGGVTAAYRILAGTILNCAGGRTPWGTWLSCEEYDEADLAAFPAGVNIGDAAGRGAVWECDPTQASQGARKPALGLFKHEAACVDPVDQRLYLTEDDADGCLYRFTPDVYPFLDAGVLEVAVVGAGGAVSWRRVPNATPVPGQPPTRDQVEGATRFRRAEGIWFDSGMVYVATTADERIHAYDTVSRRIEVVYDREATPGSRITDPDNITVSPSGDLYICENPPVEEGSLEVGLLTPDLTISPFMRFEGPKHVYDAPGLGPSEVTGAVFDPSGTRMYVTSQRARTATAGTAPGPGEVYEVTGPFRLARPTSGPLSPGNPRHAGQAIGPGQGASGALVTGAAIGVELPPRIRLEALRRRGLPVAITLDEPATVDVALRGRVRTRRELRAERRRRRRRRIARASRRYARSGPHTMRVPLDRRGRELLAGRRQNLRLIAVVTVTDENGGRDRFVRTVLVKSGRARRRRRA